MHRIEGHRFWRPFAGKAVDSYRTSCRHSSKTSTERGGEEGGFFGAGKGQIRLREKGGEGGKKW